MASIYQKENGWQVQWTDPATRKRRSRTFGTKAAAQRFGDEREKDRQLVREGLATAKQVTECRYTLIVDELADRFLAHADSYYVKNGKLTSTPHNFRDALKPLRRLYGPSAAVDIGPMALKAVRQAMVEFGWSRKNVNQQTGRVRHVFRWAVAEELLPPHVLEGLRAVAPLRRGRTEARETDPIRPVPSAHFRAVRRHVNRQVWAMIELQRLTGMRPAEVTIMRACDLDTTGTVWTYTPASHKTEHHGHERKVYLGPRAQTIVRPFLRPDLRAYLFSPTDARQDQAADAQTHRRPGQAPTPRETSRRVRDRYDSASYRRAIARACEKANVPAWAPSRLRHNAATRLRREYGIDIAQTILGHQLGSHITEIYAEANVAKAIDVIAKVG